MAASELDALDHEAAMVLREPLQQGAFGRTLLPEYVFVEVPAMRRALAAAVVVGEALLRAREIDIATASDLFAAAFDVFRAQGACGLSFNGAAIVAAARHYGADYVTTFDARLSGIDGLRVLPPPAAAAL